MNAYEQFIKLMREEGAANNPYTPFRAEMTDTEKCDIGDLVLDKDDLLVAEHLKGKLKKGDTVLVQRISDETYVIIEKVVEL